VHLHSVLPTEKDLQPLSHTSSMFQEENFLVLGLVRHYCVYPQHNSH